MGSLYEINFKAIVFFLFMKIGAPNPQTFPVLDNVPQGCTASRASIAGACYGSKLVRLQTVQTEWFLFKKRYVYMYGVFICIFMYTHDCIEHI